MSGGFDEALAGSGPRDLAMRTRALIRAVMPEVVEIPWPKQRVVVYGIGPRKMSEHFCYVAFHTPTSAGAPAYSPAPRPHATG